LQMGHRMWGFYGCAARARRDGYFFDFLSGFPDDFDAGLSAAAAGFESAG